MNAALQAASAEFFLDLLAAIGLSAHTSEAVLLASKRGTRPSAPHDQRTSSAYIFGAICPAEGKGAGLVLPSCNSEAMDWLSNRVFKSYDDILDHCCFAWNKLIDMPWKIIQSGPETGSTGHDHQDLVLGDLLYEKYEN